MLLVVIAFLVVLLDIQAFDFFVFVNPQTNECLNDLKNHEARYYSPNDNCNHSHYLYHDLFH